MEKPRAVVAMELWVWLELEMIDFMLLLYGLLLLLILPNLWSCWFLGEVHFHLFFLRTPSSLVLFLSPRLEKVKRLLVGLFLHVWNLIYLCLIIAKEQILLCFILGIGWLYHGIVILSVFRLHHRLLAWILVFLPNIISNILVMTLLFQMLVIHIVFIDVFLNRWELRYKTWEDRLDYRFMMMFLLNRYWFLLFILIKDPTGR